jgi:hypothetical protein
MDPAAEAAAYYLGRLRDGPDEDAFFGLIEAGPAVLPLLTDAFGRQENRGIRGRIAECVWQLRRPEAIGFLADRLLDPDPGLWREALNELVATGGAGAVWALQAVRESLPAAGPKSAISAGWIDEGVGQIQESEAE